ncbi:hypothetical protein ACHAXT_006932 [Thalassiosira profunda]
MSTSSSFNVITEADSPRAASPRYMLLHSQKAGLLSRSTLPFFLIAIGTGVLLSATWNKLGIVGSNCPSLTGSKNDAVSSAEIVGLTGSLARGQNSNSSFRATDGRQNDLTDSLARDKSSNSSFPIAWLMSFPNSGTSYTSYLVRTVTGLRTATNYGTENLDADGMSVRVFEDSDGGPFWSDPLKPKYAFPQAGSKGYLLTKTHCGGRCDQCPPVKYIESHRIFARRCFEGYHIEKDASGEHREVLGSHNKDLVSRAVHLIRDPFDNVVSRFHLTYKHFVKRNYTDKLAAYPRSKEGFRSFCEDLGKRFRKEEEASKFYRGVLDNDVKKLPCHADFFRFLQWHNLAFATTWDLRIPTHVLHYENYTSNFAETKDELLRFLDQGDVHEPPLFVTGKTYRDYFTEEEVQTVATMFSKLALEKTLEHTKHYFE